MPYWNNENWNRDISLKDNEKNDFSSTIFKENPLIWNKFSSEQIKEYDIASQFFQKNENDHSFDKHKKIEDVEQYRRLSEKSTKEMTDLEVEYATHLSSDVMN